ncbi:MAG: glucosamine-6-phosphate deaminase [Clostridiales bacterium]|nr:glucosamine-6-phosphate deaminase [Clostridiales bacterium]
MKIVIVKNYNELSAAAALMIADVLRCVNNPVLSLATGSTPIGAYAELVNAYRDNKISFKNVLTFNLDEYVGLPATDGNSYRAYMNKHLFDNVDIDKDNTNLPDGTADDLEQECKRYSALLEKHPRHLQLLGLGRNGHIGFNEPGTRFDSVTHVVELTPDTIKANSRLFADGAVPRRAVTMGIKDIMAAKRIVLLASGENKARAVYNTVKGRVSDSCPASVLQTHPDATLIADMEAAHEIV